MFTKITEKHILNSTWPYLASEYRTARYDEMKKKFKDALAPLAFAVEGTRCFLVFKPDTYTAAEEAVPEHLHVLIQTADFEDYMLERAFRALIEEGRVTTLKLGEKGGFATNPFERVRIVETTPSLFLELCICTAVLGIPREFGTLISKKTGLHPSKGIAPRITYNQRSARKLDYGVLAFQDPAMFWNQDFLKAVNDISEYLKDHLPTASPHEI